MANVLFVCLHNAGRSQMSQALFERAVDGRHGARSAGTTPGDAVHPEVVAVMDELGIDLRDRVPHELTEEDARWADVVVTMGCGDECPYIPGRRYVDWDLPDPKGQPIGAVRATRDEIAEQVGAMVAELDAGPGEGPETTCCLGATELDARLTAISALGAGSLLERSVDRGQHRLRFRADAETRARLEEIIAAEAKCCSFLELTLSDEGGGATLLLVIDAPGDGQATADGLAAAFARHV